MWTHRHQYSTISDFIYYTPTLIVIASPCGYSFYQLESCKERTKNAHYVYVCVCVCVRVCVCVCVRLMDLLQIYFNAFFLYRL